ncbi:MAG: macro domain-containing protein [Saprospiraceae bacterium]|nr:macro domain-containing protein [Saprospiraceae bacterium]
MTYRIGNLMEAQTEALVNTVNTVGVMGKGIALQFKERFPNNNKEYIKACKSRDLDIGKLLIVDETTLEGRKIIINFPTKKDWKHRSAYAYIESGLAALVAELQKGHIKSIAIPPLGCGNGGLDWVKVKPMMEQYLQDLPVDIQIYEPNDAIKAQLQKENKKPKESVLTDKRAMLLFAMFNYELSMGENTNVFVANKLAYFLQRVGEPMRLTFKKASYGPYSPQVAHVLYQLNGVYLKGLEQFEAKPFEPLFLNYTAYDQIKKHVEQSLTTEQRQHLTSLSHLIQGFESFLALEVLATVDFLKKENPNLDKEGIAKAIAEWSPRKKQQMTDDLISIAWKRLSDYADTFSI